MRQIALALLSTLVSLGAAAAAEPQITVELGQREIYEGQSVVYQVTVRNVEQPPTPKLGAMPDFDVAAEGQQSLNSSQITIINGIMKQVVQYGAVFQYRLTPKKSGALTIPGPTVAIDGKTIAGPMATLTVLPPDSQGVAILELSADRATVYPTQPFAVKLSVFVKELPSPHFDRDPLSVQQSPPMLQIPWLTEQGVPDGAAPKENWQQWVQGYIDREGAGFGINNLSQQSAFSIFGGGSAVAFRPKSEEVQRRDPQGREASYRRYDFVRGFVAQRAGQLRFAPVTVQGSFADRAGGDGRLIGKEVYAASKPLTVTVKDVPLAERPATYCGAIGQFHLETELTPRQVKLGDPMTLTLTLRGSGSLAAAKAPDLNKAPELAGRFKVYEATQKQENDAMRFVYSLRPLAAGDAPFPAVAIAYFDADQAAYRLLQSDPIPITVAKGETLSDEQIVAGARPAGRTGKEIEARSEGIFANISDVGLVRNERVDPQQWLMVFGGAVAGYLLFAAIVLSVRRATQDKAALRRRTAVRHARQRLTSARLAFQAGQAREAADLVQDALVGLVADVADIREVGLTPKDVGAHLRDWAVPEPVVDSVRRLLDDCDAVRYAGLAAAGNLAEESQQAFSLLVDALRAQKRFR